MVFKIDKSGSTPRIPDNYVQDDKNKLKREAKAKGQFIVSVSTDDKTLTAIAKKFNMSLTDFKNMTGLTKDALAKEQVIKNVPVDKIEKGKGLASIAKKHGMTVEQFCALNGIKKDYQPQKDEYFYVFPNQTKTEQKGETKSPEFKPENKNPLKPLKPDEIAARLEEIADNTRGAVGKTEFNEVFDQINKNNVTDVLEKFQKDNDKSLINMISDEWSSDKNARKEAMTKIFDLVADKKKIASDEVREEFITELDNQFKSWGRVSTKNLDKILDDIINPKESAETQPKVEGAVYKPKPAELSGNKARIRLGNGNITTSEQLKKDADNTAIREKRPVKRPEPVIDKNGNIIADVQIMNPTGKGALTGKTIIVNAGHGGYNPKNGVFDPGTFASDKNNKVIEEWYKNKNFTDEIIPELTSQGAKVIFMSGSAATIMKAKEKYKDADMFVSIHCDSAPTNKDKRGQTIIFRPHDNSDKKLASAVESKIETHDWLSKETCKIKADDRGLGVLKAVKDMPSILIETGYQSNETDLANIDSGKFRKDFAKLLTEGIIDYVTHK